LRRLIVGAALVAASVPAAATPSNSRSDEDSWTIAPISGSDAARMKGVSWRAGCPVPLADLRVLTIRHWGFDGRVRTGKLIVHEDVAGDVLGVFRRLHAARFPIRRIVPVDAYGASDFRSIEADNTSAFNCRYVDGTRRWSEHAYGRAIDVNPIENPYVSGGRTSHAASRPYLVRSRRRPGMAYEGGVLVEAFRAIGWGWGGYWRSVKDYQHFSASGR
jgi:D-alanyl-D-alanine carboxypeptidase-like protein